MWKQSQFSYSSPPSPVLNRTWTILLKAGQQYMTRTVTVADGQEFLEYQVERDRRVSSDLSWQKAQHGPAPTLSS